MFGRIRLKRIKRVSEDYYAVAGRLYTQPRPRRKVTPRSALYESSEQKLKRFAKRLFDSL